MVLRPVRRALAAPLLALAPPPAASAAERICTRTRRSYGDGYYGTEKTCFSSDDPIYKSGQAAGAFVIAHPGETMLILAFLGLVCLYIARERGR